jgi:predicted nucleotidyltransferase component of viral defense system
MDHLAAQSEIFTWTFGGGTVLMLRLNHRHSKDVDLFIKDPQYLNYLNPRLSDLAESITSDYDESAEFIKLYLEPGEIDIVVGASLTHAPFDLVRYQGREIRVETSAEIVAKKFHHRGDRATARDLYDLCAVATLEPEAITVALPFMKRQARQLRRGVAGDRLHAVDARKGGVAARGTTGHPAVSPYDTPGHSDR